MSLTLARLCGEWRLVSENYKARKQKIQSSDSDLLYSYRRLFYCGILLFWLKYEAQIAIFRILAAIDRFSQISRKMESRWRNRKAVEEYFIRFLGNWKAVEENRILCEENRSLGEGKSQFSQDILKFLAILGSRFDTKFSTTCAHGFTWLVFQFSTAHNLTLTSAFDTIS